LIGLWVRLLRVPYHWLYVFVLAFACVGVYSMSSSFFDIYCLVFFGILGYLLKAADCNPALSILGYILGPLFAETFRRALALSRGDFMVFLERPISLTFIGIGAVVLLATTTSFVRRGRVEAPE